MKYFYCPDTGAVESEDQMLMLYKWGLIEDPENYEGFGSFENYIDVVIGKNGNMWQVYQSTYLISYLHHNYDDFLDYMNNESFWVFHLDGYSADENLLKCTIYANEPDEIADIKNIFDTYFGNQYKAV